LTIVTFVMPSELDKARGVTHLENGSKIRELAETFGVGKSSIWRIKKKWENNTGSLQMFVPSQ
jgi:transposase